MIPPAEHIGRWRACLALRSNPTTQRGSVPFCGERRLLQGLAAPRTLVDKTPQNLSHAAFVTRGAVMFAAARFVHLVRHPVVQARSYMSLVTDTGGASGWAEAEAEWVQYQRTALDFVATPAHAALTVSVRYEDFVTDPEAVTRRVCAALGIEWEAEMANPYESAEATKSFQSADGRHVGDPKLLRRSAIDARQADKWRTTAQPEPLRPATRELAGRFGCALPPTRPCCVSIAPRLDLNRQTSVPSPLRTLSCGPICPRLRAPLTRVSRPCAARAIARRCVARR